MNSLGRGPARPIHAATLMLLRDAQAGVEVLMTQRPSTTAFAADAFVFPGGKVEPADCAMPSTVWSGLDVETTAVKMDVPPDLALGFHVAAVREAFEEIGILLASKTRNVGDIEQSLREMRTSLHTGSHEWSQQLSEAGLRLDLGSLRWWSWWITPPSLPRRYNTQFFVARCPPRQILTDSREVEEAVWVTPSAALESASKGAWYLMRPTLATLEELHEETSVAGVLRTANDVGPRQRQPRP